MAVYLLKLTINFSNGDSYDVINHDIISIVSSENMTDSNVSYLPGICEQYANISIYDRNNFFHNRAMQDKSMEGEVNIYMFNAASPQTLTLIDSYDISECNIESDNSNIEINCRDKSHTLENIYIKEANIANRTLHNLLNIMFSEVPNASWQYQDIPTQSRCENITLPNSWYKSGVLKTLLNKVCIAGMLRIYYKKGIYYVGRCL